MFQQIQEYIAQLQPEALTATRKSVLQPLVDYIQLKIAAQEKIQLIFICTHNSRRSHLGQVWAQITAYYYGIDLVACFSGGTEATACNPRTIAALQRAGLMTEMITPAENPLYEIRYGAGIDPIFAFSKVYDHVENPQQGFAAVMTCSHAEENCPFIPGAEKRFAVMYEDPKISDDTLEERVVYDARCKQIATEMCYVFKSIKRG